MDGEWWSAGSGRCRCPVVQLPPARGEARGERLAACSPRRALGLAPSQFCARFLQSNQLLCMHVGVDKH